MLASSDWSESEPEPQVKATARRKSKRSRKDQPTSLAEQLENKVSSVLSKQQEAFQTNNSLN